MYSVLSHVLQLMSLYIATLHSSQKKVPTFKLTVTLSNLNRFSKFLHCWKAYEICYKTMQHYPPYLRHVATLHWEIKNSNFTHRYSAYMEENANKLHFKCTNFNFCTRVTVCRVYLCVFHQNLVFVAEYHVDC